MLALDLALFGSHRFHMSKVYRSNKIYYAECEFTEVSFLTGKYLSNDFGSRQMLSWTDVALFK